MFYFVFVRSLKGGKMFEYLKLIDEKIYNRYQTVERNIKAASNSFYDAYLDMLEQFVKFVIEKAGSEFFGTCGQMLMRQEIKNYFLETVRLDEFSYNKMRDYTQKVNAHKHKNEKNIMPDTIVTYMKVFHTVTSAYVLYCGEVACGFDANYFLDIFGQYEKLNDRLRKSVDDLRAELSRSIEEHKIKEEDIKIYKKLLSQSEIDRMSLEEQTLELYHQISVLKDIKLSSMEEKLNKTIDLLNELTESVIENRAISYAVGDTIVGQELFKGYIEKARKTIPKISDK